MKAIVYGAILMFLFLHVGCGKCERENEKKDTAFVVIDGKPLTESYVKDIVCLQARIAQLAGHPISTNDFPVWGNRVAMQIIPSLLSGRLWEDEIRRQGLVAADEDIQKVLKRFNRQLATNLTSVAEMAPLFGNLSDVFKTQFDRECLFEAYSRQNFDLAVGEKDISRYYQSKTNALQWAAQTNADAKKHADDAWMKLQQGVAWEDVAKACSEDAELDDAQADYYKEWSMFNPRDFSEDPLGRILPALKAGQYSKPFESDEGMLIVKVNEVEDGLYTCARILFRMACEVEVPDVETAKKEIAQRKFREAQQRLQRRLRMTSRIEYPLGTNFTYKIWAEPSQSPLNGLKFIPPSHQNNQGERK